MFTQRHTCTPLASSSALRLLALTLLVAFFERTTSMFVKTATTIQRFPDLKLRRADDLNISYQVKHPLNFNTGAAATHPLPILPPRAPRHHPSRESLKTAARPSSPTSNSGITTPHLHPRPHPHNHATTQARTYTHAFSLPPHNTPVAHALI